MIMCYSYSTHQCAGRLQYLQGKDHNGAFNAGDQYAVAFLLCFRLPGQSEVGPQRGENQILPLALSSALGVQPHGLKWRSWSWPSKNHALSPEEASHSREKYWKILHKDWANPSGNGCLETTSHQMKTMLIQFSMILEMFAVSRHSPFKMEVLLSKLLEV